MLQQVQTAISVMVQTGFECVCEGERKAYSPSLGICSDIEILFQLLKYCGCVSVFDEVETHVVLQD